MMSSTRYSSFAESLQPSSLIRRFQTLGYFSVCGRSSQRHIPVSSLTRSVKHTWFLILVSLVDLRHPVVTTLIHLHASLLLPLFNHLWLATGTGNANFFYASTLVFGMANGAGLLDSIWAGLTCAISVGDDWDVSQE